MLDCLLCRRGGTVISSSVTHLFHPWYRGSRLRIADPHARKKPLAWSSVFVCSTLSLNEVVQSIVFKFVLVWLYYFSRNSQLHLFLFVIYFSFFPHPCWFYFTIFYYVKRLHASRSQNYTERYVPSPPCPHSHPPLVGHNIVDSVCPSCFSYCKQVHMYRYTCIFLFPSLSYTEIHTRHSLLYFVCFT